MVILKVRGKVITRTKRTNKNRGRKLPLMKNENEAINKLLKPILKEQYFVRTTVRVDRLHSKLRTEGVLSAEEIDIKHPFHPDIDVLFWAKKYSGEPDIMASEVKYFRLKEGAVYPNIYEGLGEALMLLTYGIDYVSLWHLFDPEIPSETVSRYRDLTQNLVTDINSPINYQSWLLPETPKKSVNQKPTHLKASVDSTDLIIRITESVERYFFTSSLTQNLKTNPLKYRWDAKILRAIIKKGFRIVNR